MGLIYSDVVLKLHFKRDDVCAGTE